MLTKEILAGMNLLTLGGFIVMGLGLTLARQQRARAPVAVALMAAGTILVGLGLYLLVPANT